MNKKQLIAICLHEMRTMWDGNHDYSARTAIYNACKDLCYRYGYTGGAFDQIWNAANRLHAIENGVYVPGLGV